MNVKFCSTFITTMAFVFFGANASYVSSPLHWAVENDNIQAVQKYLEEGANANEFDNNLMTGPLFEVKSAQVAKILIEHGADVDRKGFDGRTPLHACRNPEVAKVLLQHGADVNALDNKKNTPLHLCCLDHPCSTNLYIGHFELTQHCTEQCDHEQLFPTAPNPDQSENSWTYQKGKLLLEYGAQFNIANKFGSNPITSSKDALGELIKQKYDLNPNPIEKKPKYSFKDYTIGMAFGTYVLALVIFGYLHDMKMMNS